MLCRDPNNTGTRRALGSFRCGNGLGLVHLSSIRRELKVNLWDYVGIIVAQHRLKDSYPTARSGLKTTIS